MAVVTFTVVVSYWNLTVRPECVDRVCQFLEERGMIEHPGVQAFKLEVSSLRMCQSDFRAWRWEEESLCTTQSQEVARLSTLLKEEEERAKEEERRQRELKQKQDLELRERLDRVEVRPQEWMEIVVFSVVMLIVVALTVKIWNLCWNRGGGVVENQEEKEDEMPEFRPEEVERKIPSPPRRPVANKPVLK